ncbi:MAG: thrombospondin type 3 repeat-containing protein [Patescibacteria group bacterium]
MLNIFDKKNKQEIKQPFVALSSAQPVQEEIVLSNDIIIHSMPERFRSDHIKVSQAKKTGMIIIVGGIIFLIIISALFYYFFFSRKPNKSTQTPVSTSTPVIEPVKTEIPVEAQPAQISETIVTTSPVLPSEESFATSTATSTFSEAEINKPDDLSAGVDSDNDGLTDEEEKIFKTNSAGSDTDGDGYNDLEEVLNGYNPAGAGRLSTNPNLQIYNNKTYNYDLLYPTAWSQINNGGDDSIMFKAVDNSFVQVITQNNSEQQTIDIWYKQQFNIDSVDQKKLITNNNWNGIINFDGLTVYLMDLSKKNIFTITYNPASSNTLNYPNLFKAIVKSFKVIK